MAAPQVAGITALVKQAIRERGLSQEGITDRALAQSLMMSTAVPMRDENGNFFPVIQQGAGLVNTAAATSADTYVLVDGQPDGKVKAELGEDPERRGEYQFGLPDSQSGRPGKDLLPVCRCVHSGSLCELCQRQSG